MNAETPKDPLSTNGAAPTSVRVRRAEALVNPASGLANDYLNLFNEIVMLIEQLPMMPELMDDIQKWHPVTYRDYFANSILPGRGSALDTYAALTDRFKRDFDDVVAELDRKATGCVAAIRRHHKVYGESKPDEMAVLCAKGGETLRAVLDQATNLVNHGVRTARLSEQDKADRLFGVTLRRSA